MRSRSPWASPGHHKSAFLSSYIYNQATTGIRIPSGFADVGVLLSKELLIDNGGWIPNLVGSVGWTSPTSLGTSFTPIPYVSGFQAGLTASKRLDPLVVFASASYFSAARRFKERHLILQMSLPAGWAAALL